MIKLPANSTLYPYQDAMFRAHYIDGYKRLMAVLSRRGGKTFMSLNFLAAAAMQRRGTYWHCFPKLNQGRKHVWDGMDEQGRPYLDAIPKELIKARHNNEMKLTLHNGSIIQIVGSDKYANLRGGNPLGIICDEGAEQHPQAWPVMAPILAKNGGFALWIYTPRGRNHAYQLFKKASVSKSWFVQHLNCEQLVDWHGNRLVTDEMIEQSRESGMSEAFIQQEFYCSFDYGIEGAVFSKELDSLYAQKRITHLTIQKNAPTWIIYDLGIRDSTIMWFLQYHLGRWNFVDYYENRNQAYSHYFDYANNWELKHQVRCEADILPHDANIRGFNLDTRSDLCSQAGRNPIVLGAGNNEQDFDKAKNFMLKSQFDVERCEVGLNALTSFKRSYAAKAQHYTDFCHDWASHASHAFKYASNAFWRGYLCVDDDIDNTAMHNIVDFDPRAISR